MSKKMSTFASCPKWVLILAISVSMKVTLKFWFLTLCLLFTTAAFSENKTDKISVSGLRIAVKEGGDARLNVVLKEQPKKDVTVKVRSSNLHRMYVVEGAGMVFTKDNWNQPQSAFFKTIDDDVCMGSELIDVTVVTLSKDTAFNGCELTQQILVNDDEKAGLLLSSEMIELDEESRSGTVEMRLRSKPAEDVMVELRSTDRNVDLDNPVLFFTGHNWNSPQRVTIKADSRVSGREAIRLLCSSASASEVFDGLKVSAEIRIAGVDVTNFAAAEKAEQEIAEEAEASQNRSAAAQKAIEKQQKAEAKAALKQQKAEEKERWRNMTPAQKKKAKALAAKKKAAEKAKAARLKEIAKKKAAKLKEMEKKKAAKQKEQAKKAKAKK